MSTTAGLFKEPEVGAVLGQKAAECLAGRKRLSHCRVKSFPRAHIKGQRFVLGQDTVGSLKTGSDEEAA